MTISNSRQFLGKYSLLLGSATILACAGPALAEAAPDGLAADAQQVAELSSDIVVTATRRDEKLHDVPISASVLSNESVQSLTSSGMDMRALSFTVPSLNVETTQGRNFPRFYVRGYGNTDYGAFASQPVGLVLDDVVQENPNLKGFPMFDLADVQLYRGPQGTLFGRNAPAGVISVRTAAPKLDSFGGYVSATNGTFNTATLEGVVNVPLSSVLAARFSAQYQHRDDFVHNPITRRDEGGWDDIALRAQLLYDPGTNFSALVNVHARILDGGVTHFRANAIKPGTDEPSEFAKFREIYTDIPNTQYSRTIGASARLTWKVGDLTVASISSWEKILRTGSSSDIDGGYGASYAPPSGPGFIPFPVASTGGIPNLDQLSQEFRVSSDAAGRFRWLAGLYFFHEYTTNFTINRDGLTGAPQDYQGSRQVNNAGAVFGSVTFDATDALELRGGLRYTRDQKDFDIVQLVNLDYQPRHADSKLGNVSWDASATYKISPDVSAYIRAATGFRAPSFGAPTTFNGLQVARQETIASIEGGLKTFALDRKLRADFSVYYYRIKDQQLTAVGGTSNATRLLNADRTIGYGAEGELQANITPNFDFTLSGSYNFTKLKDPTLSVGVCASCTVTSPKNGQGNALIDGNPLPQAPRFIGSAALNYQVPVSNTANLYFHPDISYRSSYNFYLYESKEFRSQAFLNLGLRAGLRFDDNKYEAAIFCRNCTNTMRLLQGIDFDNLTAVLNDPRIIGAQLMARF